MVDVEIDDGVAVVTLDDPERRNALNLPMVDEIVERLRPHRGATPTSAPSSSPAHRRRSAPAPTCPTSAASQRDGLRDVYEGFLRIARSTAADDRRGQRRRGRRRDEPGARLRRPPGRRVGRGSTRGSCSSGIHPGGGHTWMLRRIAGPQAAAATVLFGEVLDGAEAERIGLVWRCVDDDALLPTARELAGRAAAAPRELVIRTKATIAAMATIDDHEAAVERELEPQLWSVSQPEFRERLAAMQAKIKGNNN